MAILSFKRKSIIENINNYIILKGDIHQEAIAIIINLVSKLIRQKVRKLHGENYKSSVIMEDFYYTSLNNGYIEQAKIQEGQNI